MNVLFIGAFAPDRPDNQNGATSRAAVLFQENLLSALVAEGVPVSGVYSYFPVPSFPKSRRLFFTRGQERTTSGLIVRYLPFLNFGPLKTATLGVSSFFAVLWWGLAQGRRAHKTVMAYNLNAPPAWPMQLACRIVKAAFVPFVGDIYVPGEVVSDSLLNRLQYRSQVRAAKSLDRLIAANSAIIEDFAPIARPLLIEGGVTEEFLETFSEVPFRRETTTVLFAGQLSSLNGVPLFLDAIRLLPDPMLRFVFAGRGEHEAAVREFSKSDPRFTCLGLVSHDEVLRLYRQADILVSLRRTDNKTNRYVFPSKTIECIATGRPLLTTRTGHMESVFGGVVVLLDDETPHSVATKISDIASWSDEQRARHYAKSRELIANERTWRRNAAKIKDFLQEAA